MFCYFGSVFAFAVRQLDICPYNVGRKIEKLAEYDISRTEAVYSDSVAALFKILKRFKKASVVGGE